MIRIRDPFRRAQVAVAALFCFLGFQYASWVSRVPTFTAKFDLSPGRVGLMLMATGVGASVSLPLVNSLMRSLGSRRLAGVSALALTGILLALAVTPNYLVTMLVLFCDGVAVACLNVAMNAQASALEATYQRNTMAKMHAAFSCGLFAAALVTSGVTALSRSLAAHFGVAAVILGVFLALAWSGALPEDTPATEAASPSESSPDASGRRRWHKPVLVAVWLSLALVFGEVTEGAMNDWSALYLKDVVHAGPSVTPLGIAVVSAMMLLARLFADGWRSRWGDQRVVVVGATVAAVGLAAALLAGGVVPTLIGFACVGLGMAAVTPCIYVGAARLGPEVLALVATMGTIGLLAGPPVIGFIAEQTSLVGGMSAVAVLALLAAACASQINWPPEVSAVAAESDVDDRNPVTQP